MDRADTIRRPRISVLCACECVFFRIGVQIINLSVLVLINSMRGDRRAVRVRSVAGLSILRNGFLFSAPYGWLVGGVVVVRRETEGDRVVFWQSCPVQAQTNVT